MSKIHKIIPVNEYKGHLACYPDSYEGIIIRDTNICLQFRPSTTTAVINPNYKEEAHQDLSGSGGKNFRISTNGTRVDTLGIRIHKPFLPHIINDLLKNLKQKDKPLHKAIIDYLIQEKAL